MPQKVLIVDDEAAIRRTYSNIVASLGYDFDVASDGIECLEKLKAAKFDLVLMNIKMPKMDGVETLDRIVKTYPTIPVIMVSAMVIDSTVTMLKEHGAFAVFKKPAEYKALVGATQEALELRNRTTIFSL